MPNFDAQIASHVIADTKPDAPSLQAAVNDKFQLEVQQSSGGLLKGQAMPAERFIDPDSKSEPQPIPYDRHLSLVPDNLLPNHKSEKFHEDKNLSGYAIENSREKILPDLRIEGDDSLKGTHDFSWNSNKDMIDRAVQKDLTQNAVPGAPPLDFTSRGWSPENMLKGNEFGSLWGVSRGDTMGQEKNEKYNPGLDEFNKKAGAATMDIDRKEDEIALKKWDALPADKKAAIEKEMENADRQSREAGLGASISGSHTPLRDAYMNSLSHDLAPLERERQARMHQVWNTLPKATKSEIYREQETEKFVLPKSHGL